LISFREKFWQRELTFQTFGTNFPAELHTPVVCMSFTHSHTHNTHTHTRTHTTIHTTRTHTHTHTTTTTTRFPSIEHALQSGRLRHIPKTEILCETSDYALISCHCYYLMYMQWLTIHFSHSTRCCIKMPSLTALLCSGLKF
jgi:hypothetical protein